MRDTEGRLRAAAFGTHLGVTDAVLADAASAAPRLRWLAAVVTGARGHYARAAATLEPLLGDGDPVVASLAASTLASHRRQLGGHANARTLDAAALRAIATATARLGEADSDGADAAGALADALLGLAADALALGRQREARRLLARVAVEPSCWRTRVRHGWVSAEVELAAGDAAAARPHAARAGKLAREHGGVRHALKSDLVLAAAAQDTRLASTVLDEAGQFGLAPLMWPAALLLGRDATTMVYGVLRRTDPLGRALAAASPWVPGVSEMSW